MGRPVLLCMLAGICAITLFYSGSEPHLQHTVVAFTSHQSADGVLQPTKTQSATRGVQSSIQSDVFWSAGGVLGASEGSENLELDRLHVRHHEMLRYVSLGLSRWTDKDAPRKRADMEALLATLTVNNNDDCVRRPTPHEILMCHLWAVTQHKHDKSINGSSRPLFSSHPLHSMCSLFLACAFWRRGRYSVPLTPQLLRDTFVAIKDRLAKSNSTKIALQNLVHGGHNWNEYDWLPMRLRASRQLHNRRVTSLDVRPFFQGGDLSMGSSLSTNATNAQQRHYVFRGNGARDGDNLQPLSQLEMLAVLYHRASANTKTVSYVSMEAADDRGNECFAAAIDVLLFQGDSVTRQLFQKLIESIRRGSGSIVEVPYGPDDERLRTSFPSWPTMGIPHEIDVVLAVYSTHDEVTMFDSVVSRRLHPEAVTPTVNEFFVNISNQRRRAHCGEPKSSEKRTRGDGLQEVQEGEALFYLVFLADPMNFRPRVDGFAPCYSRFEYDKTYPPTDLRLTNDVKRRFLPFVDPIAPVLPLRSLGVRIGLHVHGANLWEHRPSPNAFNWLARMATHCNITDAWGAYAHPNYNASLQRKLGHPHSDGTHFYLVSSMLWLKYGLHGKPFEPVTMFSPTEELPLLLGDSSARPSGSSSPVQPMSRARLEAAHLLRVAFPFDWLKWVSSHASSRGHNATREHVFLSRVRVLDMGKVFLATNTPFHLHDGVHEGCRERDWLVGAAGRDDAGRLALLKAANRLIAAARPFVEAAAPPADRSDEPKHNMFYEMGKDCGLHGSLLTLTALALDILVDDPR